MDATIIIEKGLENREEQAANQPTKSRVIVENEEPSDEINNGKSDDGQLCRLPEIETRVHSENILIKIQCEQRKGVLVNLLVELEKLNLDFVSFSAVTFGNFILEITIVAEMEKELSVPADEVVKALRSVIIQQPLII